MYELEQVTMPQCEQVHGERNGDVRESTSPDRTALESEGAKNETGDNCRECFGRRLLKVNHHVEPHHDEDRQVAEAANETVQQEPQKEELQAGELNRVQDLPSPEQRPKPLIRLDLVKGIARLERLRKRRDQDERCDGHEQQVHHQYVPLAPRPAPKPTRSPSKAT